MKFTGIAQSHVIISIGFIDISHIQNQFFVHCLCGRFTGIFCIVRICLRIAFCVVCGFCFHFFGIIDCEGHFRLLKAICFPVRTVVVVISGKTKAGNGTLQGSHLRGIRFLFLVILFLDIPACRRLSVIRNRIRIVVFFHNNLADR